MAETSASVGARGPRRAPGRPRRTGEAPAGSTREQILAAASRLFAEQGFAETTTRQIADAVGIRQASLYYHFADKGALLNALLLGTVEPPLSFGAWLRERPESAEAKLYALAAFDLAGIMDDPMHLQQVYLRPDVQQEERAEARDHQRALKALYRELALAVLGEQAPAALRADADLVFGLVEGFVLLRNWGQQSSRSAYAAAVPRGCLRLLDIPEERIAEAARQATGLLAEFTAEES